MRLDAFLYAMLTVSLFITGGVLIWGNVIDNYDINTTTTSEGANFTGVYDTIDETYNISKGMKDETLGTELEGGDQSWESMAKGSYSAIRLIKNSFTLVGDILDAVARQIGVPAWIINVAMTAILIGIIFAIIYLVFRVGKGD